MERKYFTKGILSLFLVLAAAKKKAEHLSLLETEKFFYLLRVGGDVGLTFRS